MQRKHPDKNRAYHGLAIKKELEQLKTHSKQSFRERAENLLKQFKLPPPQDSTIDQQSSSTSVQLANSITNNAHTINQAAQQTIYQEGLQKLTIPAKRPYNELENVYSDDPENNDLDDLISFTDPRDDKDVDSM